MPAKMDLEYYKTLLSILLADEGVKVREHDFGLAAFGNWHIEYEFNNNGFKIRWDGRERRITHQLETEEVWLNQNLFTDLNTKIENDIPVPREYWENLKH